MTPTERLQRDFFLACFAALDPERATLPVAPRGIAAPQPLAPVGHKPPVTLPAQPQSRIAAGQSQPRCTTPGGAPSQSSLLVADPAGGHSSSEAGARVARPIIPAARRGGGAR